MLSSPSIYFYARHWMLLGLPFDQWVELYGLNNPDERIADLGCGPCDILRYVDSDKRPAFYLGIDNNALYLDAARYSVKNKEIDSEFVNLDLSKLTSDNHCQQLLLDLLEKYRITKVLLLGVLHHIDDSAVRSTLSLISRSTVVKAVITQDVIFLPGWKVNNFLARHDRGKHVRTEEEYRKLLEHTGWNQIQVDWTSPGLSSVKYIHFRLSR